MMNPEFSPEEINQIVRAARVWAPGFTQEQLQELVNSQHQLADSGFCKAAWGMLRLEQEKGIPCTEALDGYEQLLRDKAELETELASLREELIAQQDANREAREQCGQIKGAIEQAKEQLQAVQAERQREEKELVAFRMKAEREKQRVDRELEEYQRIANVAREEITGAGKLKDQLASRGFTIEFALDLCQEFVGHENAREELAKALKEHQTLTNYIVALNEWAEGRKKALQADIKELEGNRHQLEGVLSQLRAERGREETILSQLSAEIAENGEIVGFYHRYLLLQPLIEYLGSWVNVTFHHCNWCGALFWILCPGKFKISARKCPWCGLILVEPDRNAYAAIGQPPGTSLKLLP